MKNLVTLTLLVIALTNSYGQIRVEIGGEIGLALKDGSHDYLGWGGL